MAPKATGRTLERTVDSLDVEVHGDIALTTGRIHIRAESANPHWRDYTIRYVRIYAKARDRGGRWQLVTHHSTSDAQGAPLPVPPR
jgi:ketosteroid isomerase-like protein